VASSGLAAPRWPLVEDGTAALAELQDASAWRIGLEAHLRTGTAAAAERLTALLGYRRTPGVAARSVVAALASEGGSSREEPSLLAVLAEAGDVAPQSLEANSPATVDSAASAWTTGAVRTRRAAQMTTVLHFETEGFGLAPGRWVLLEASTSGTARAIATVSEVRIVSGADGRTYVEVKLDREVALRGSASAVTVRTPSIRAAVTNGEPPEFPAGDDGTPARKQQPVHNPADVDLTGDPDVTLVWLDAVYRQLRVGDPVIVASSSGAGSARVVTVQETEEATVTLGNVAALTTIARLERFLPLDIRDPSKPPAPVEEVGNKDEPRRFSFHFAFVNAGKLTTLPATELSRADFTSPLELEGPVDVPERARKTRRLAQDFLLEDANGQGALVAGAIDFRPDGSATFSLARPSELPLETWKLPLTIYGNLVEVTEGESVSDEVLGSGDARVPNQQFKLKKKPLTYLPSTSPESLVQSTLDVRVNGLRWREVPSFYGCGPEDEVFLVRHDADLETLVTFGDGVRGRRLPSGVHNVVASYRFGATGKAPQAGSITQLASPVKGVRAVRSPVAGTPGRGPETVEELRTAAPRVALLLGRAVSATDFEALATLSPGVVRASASYGWIDEELQAGMRVHYVGETDAATLREALTARADPTMPLRVSAAKPIAARLALTIEVNPRFEREVVARNVVDALTDKDQGVLSKKRVPIGGALAWSVVYEAVMRVEGVVGVARGVFEREGGLVTRVDPHGAYCVETGHYLDFSPVAGASAVAVTAVPPLGPAPASERRNGEGKHHG
jgi:hypothetical protein